MSARYLLLLSNSTLYGSDFLQWASEDIKTFLLRKSVCRVLFIPYAGQDQDKYEAKARKAFAKLGFEIDSIHKASDPLQAVVQAQAIFIGGGNTFKLLKTLYDNHLISPIQDKVLQEGMPYIGASAGSNVATVNICTTNDMPIVYPPSFKALNLVPFNINAHYVEPEENSKHMGESRQKRIAEYHQCEESWPVVALREGNSLLIEGEKITLRGLPQSAKLFCKNEDPKEYSVGSDLSFLLKKL